LTYVFADADHKDSASELIDELVWPAIEEGFGRLPATPGRGVERHQ
jgi:hypothetical protein